MKNLYEVIEVHSLGNHREGFDANDFFKIGQVELGEDDDVLTIMIDEGYINKGYKKRARIERSEFTIEVWEDFKGSSRLIYILQRDCV